MTIPVLLASTSETRRALLANAGVPFQAQPSRVDEETLKAALLAEGTSPRDIADALAEQKARKISARNSQSLVIGCDQVLEHEGGLVSKPSDPDHAMRQLTNMGGTKHRLFSAAVICENARPVWRHVGSVTLTMRSLSDAYIKSYVDRNWDSIRDSVGAYKLEEEGVRLFSSIEGDYFTVLGMPLLEILDYLTIRGVLQS